MEDEAEQFDLPCPNLATEDTYGDGEEDDVRGRRQRGCGSEALRRRRRRGLAVALGFVREWKKR